MFPTLDAVSYPSSPLHPSSPKQNTPQLGGNDLSPSSTPTERYNTKDHTYHILLLHLNLRAHTHVSLARDEESFYSQRRVLLQIENDISLPRKISISIHQCHFLERAR